MTIVIYQIISALIIILESLQVVKFQGTHHDNYIVISNLKELTQAEKIAKNLNADIVSHLN
jgi:putative cell wall-binding protein